METYRVEVSKPLSRGIHARDTNIDLRKYPRAAALIARFDVHPLGEPIRLFNNQRIDDNESDSSQIALTITQVDETPGPIPIERLTEGTPAGAPVEYVSIETYDSTSTNLQGLDISDMGLQLHLPESEFPGEIWPKPTDPQIWSIRGANLCAWETVIMPPLNDHEIAIDPIIGRIVIGVDTAAKGTALVDHLLLTYTYGAVGPVGAHPISHSSLPPEWNVPPVVANFHQNPNGLRNALNNIQNSNSPIVIEIDDSMTHELDISTISGTIVEDGGPNLQLNSSLVIRAANGQRPIIKLYHLLIQI